MAKKPKWKERADRIGAMSDADLAEKLYHSDQAHLGTEGYFRPRTDVERVSLTDEYNKRRKSQEEQGPAPIRRHYQNSADKGPKRRGKARK